MKTELEEFKVEGIAKNIAGASENITALLLYLQRKYAKDLRGDADELGRRVIVIDDVIELIGEVSGSVEKSDLNPPRKRPKLNRSQDRT